MIRAAARTDQLVQRLRARALRIVAERAAARPLRSTRRSDWHSAETLWPDLFGDLRDGK
jgi:hypothetical protein